MAKISTKTKVNEDNYVLVDENKLKEDQQKEYLEAVDRYERECLKSFSATRSRDCGQEVRLPKTPAIVGGTA